MTANMALKRARKAQRRKLQVAEKRRAEASETSLPPRVHHRGLRSTAAVPTTNRGRYIDYDAKSC